MGFVANPFTNRGVITDPADFFGRKDQVNEIITRLRAMQSTSVVGERRIGKSSLLYNVARTGAGRLDDPAYRFFYVDLQDAHFHTADGFLQYTLSKLGLETEVIKSGGVLNHNLVAFTDQIEKLEQSGRHLVLCLDEFENTFKHPAEFTEDFFDHMRAQLNLRKIAFVTATQRPLQVLSLEGKLTSPFYNLFTAVELGELAESEAYELLAAYHQKVDFTNEELTFILDHLERHPLKLQILCDWVMKNRRLGMSESDLADEVAREYGNFFVGTFDPKKLWKMKKAFSLDKIKRLLDTIKAGRDTISGKE